VDEDTYAAGSQLRVSSRTSMGEVAGPLVDRSYGSRYNSFRVGWKLRAMPPDSTSSVFSVVLDYYIHMSPNASVHLYHGRMHSAPLYRILQTPSARKLFPRSIFIIYLHCQGVPSKYVP
jgi:hypothetical protein